MNKSYVQLKALAGRGRPIHPRWLSKQVADGALETVVREGQRVIELQSLIGLLEELAAAPGPDPKQPFTKWIR